jgi:gluconate kinase
MRRSNKLAHAADRPATGPNRYVVVKPTTAEGIAGRLSGRIVEADLLHFPADTRTMSQRLPLDDAARWPWL